MSDRSTPSIIAADQRLSQSILWQIQRAYFLQNGLKAWQDDVVPHQISSSLLMARAYSQITLGYLRDCVAAAEKAGFLFKPDEPIYIVELGAGSGRLAHHFLHQFQSHLAQSPLAGLSFRYVMTDFVPDLLGTWQQQERFEPWFEHGLLDVALFDAVTPRPLHLQYADITLTPDKVVNPIILIANYFFDSIPQDSFAIADGQLCHNLLSVISSQPEDDLADAAIWDRLEFAYESVPLAEPPYADDAYNEILAEYEATLPETSLTFPNVGLDCLKFWQQFGHGRQLLLTSDRGYTLMESLPGQEDPLPNLHGSFSLMVNYHALGQYVARQGGLALHTDHYQDNLQTAVFLQGQLPQAGLETQLAFQLAVQTHGPDDFFALKQALEPTIGTLTLPQILSYLRLTLYDANVFRECFPALRDRLRESDPVWFADVVAVLDEIRRLYLPLREDDDLEQLMRELYNLMGMADDGR